MAGQDQTGRQAVIETLRARILSGDLPAGRQMPTLSEIVTEFGVKKDSAQHVIDTLAREGLVVKQHGRGSYVREFQTIARSTPSRITAERWLAGIAIQDADTVDRPRDVETNFGEAPVPSWAAKPLGLEVGELAAYRDRKFTVEKRPVQLAISFLPLDLARGTAILSKDTGPGGTYARLADAGHQPTWAREYFRARMPVPVEAEALALPVGTPVLEITRHAFEASGRCVGANRMVLDGTAYLPDNTFPL